MGDIFQNSNPLKNFFKFFNMEVEHGGTQMKKFFVYVRGGVNQKVCEQLMQASERNWKQLIHLLSPLERVNSFTSSTKREIFLEDLEMKKAALRAMFARGAKKTELIEVANQHLRRLLTLIPEEERKRIELLL